LPPLNPPELATMQNTKMKIAKMETDLLIKLLLVDGALMMEKITGKNRLL